MPVKVCWSGFTYFLAFLAFFSFLGFFSFTFLGFFSFFAFLAFFGFFAFLALASRSPVNKKAAAATTIASAPAPPIMNQMKPWIDSRIEGITPLSPDMATTVV